MYNVAEQGDAVGYGQMSIWEMRIWPKSLATGDFVTLCIPRRPPARAEDHPGHMLR